MNDNIETIKADAAEIEKLAAMMEEMAKPEEKKVEAPVDGQTPVQNLPQS